MARLYWLMNRPGDALKVEHHMAALAKHPAWEAVAARAESALALGADEAAQVLADGLASLGARDGLPFSRFRIPLAYGNRKNAEQALKWLERSMETGGYGEDDASSQRCRVRFYAQSPPLPRPPATGGNY
jgi:hypothetical protein